MSGIKGRSGVYDHSKIRGKRKSPMSLEVRDKVSNSKKGSVPWNKGKQGLYTATKETRMKLGLVHIGNRHSAKPRSKELREKLKLTALRGEAHPNWKGGLTRDRQGNVQYRQWRSDIFERDNWTCQTCGLRGCYLEAHHIKAWAHFKELRYELSNGVTLCRDCHKLTDNYKGKAHGFHRDNGNTEDKEPQ